MDNSSEAIKHVPQQVVTTNIISMSIEETQLILREMYLTTCDDGASLAHATGYAMLWQSKGDTGAISIFAVNSKNTFGYHRRMAVGTHSGYFSGADPIEGGKLPMTPDGERKVFLSCNDILELNNWSKKLPKAGTVLFIWKSTDGTSGELCVRCIPKAVKAKEPELFIVQFSYADLCLNGWVSDYRLPFNMGRSAREAANNGQFLRTFGSVSLLPEVLSWLNSMVAYAKSMSIRFVFFNGGKRCYAALHSLEMWFMSDAESRAKQCG